MSNVPNQSNALGKSLLNALKKNDSKDVKIDSNITETVKSNPSGYSDTVKSFKPVSNQSIDAIIKTNPTSVSSITNISLLKGILAGTLKEIPKNIDINSSSNTEIQAPIPVSVSVTPVISDKVESSSDQISQKEEIKKRIIGRKINLSTLLGNKDTEVNTNIGSKNESNNTTRMKEISPVGENIVTEPNTTDSTKNSDTVITATETFSNPNRNDSMIIYTSKELHNLRPSYVGRPNRRLMEFYGKLFGIGVTYGDSEAITFFEPHHKEKEKNREHRKDHRETSTTSGSGGGGGGGTNINHHHHNRSGSNINNSSIVNSASHQKMREYDEPPTIASADTVLSTKKSNLSKERGNHSSGDNSNSIGGHNSSNSNTWTRNSGQISTEPIKEQMKVQLSFEEQKRQVEEERLKYLNMARQQRGEKVSIPTDDSINTISYGSYHQESDDLMRELQGLPKPTSSSITSSLATTIDPIVSLDFDLFSQPIESLPIAIPSLVSSTSASRFQSIFESSESSNHHSYIDNKNHSNSGSGSVSPKIDNNDNNTTTHSILGSSHSNTNNNSTDRIDLLAPIEDSFLSSYLPKLDSFLPTNSATINSSIASNRVWVESLTGNSNSNNSASTSSGGDHLNLLQPSMNQDPLQSIYDSLSIGSFHLSNESLPNIIYSSSPPPLPPSSSSMKNDNENVLSKLGFQSDKGSNISSSSSLSSGSNVGFSSPSSMANATGSSSSSSSNVNSSIKKTPQMSVQSKLQLQKLQQQSKYMKSNPGTMKSPSQPPSSSDVPSSDIPSSVYETPQKSTSQASISIGVSPAVAVTTTTTATVNVTENSKKSQPKFHKIDVSLLFK